MCSEALRAAAQTLTLYPEVAFSHFQAAMVHVARRRLLEAETVLRQGAAVQDRQLRRGGRYPALGLHWLLGMVRLAADDVEEALRELDKEAALAEPHRLYGREFRMHAWTGRAAAQARSGRFDEAVRSYREALALYPDEVTALLGLAEALEGTGERDEGGRCRARALQILPEVERVRPIHGALIRAAMRAAQDDVQAAADTLKAALDTAPPGFACWTVPIEPAFRIVAEMPAFARVFTALADRAP